MIIDCINCGKKFSIDSDLIPKEGRTLQCGSCKHVWFFKKEELDYTKKEFPDIPKIKENISKNKAKKEKLKSEKKLQKTIPSKKNEIMVFENKKKKFTFGSFLSYLIVLLITGISLVIVIDTFKVPLYSSFPRLELLMYNLFETTKDIELFIKDLI